MAVSVSTFIITGYLIHKEMEKSALSKNKPRMSTSLKEKLEIMSSHFSSLKEFKQASLEKPDCFTKEIGVKLTKKQITVINELQNDINIDLSIEENFIQLFTKAFIAKQLKMIDNLTIEALNANPLLCYALKFDNPKDFVKYYTYQAVSRSIVTSMGFLVQNLLLYSNEYIHEGKGYDEGEGTKFDLVIDKGKKKIFFEVKSGFNDLDKGQILHYKKEISNVEKKGNEAYIGITYGKKDAKTVTSNLLETNFKDWRKKTLVGKELWKYISGKKNYHLTLSKNIRNAVLHDTDIVKKIEKKTNELVREFNSRYNSMDNYYDSLW